MQAKLLSAIAALVAVACWAAPAPAQSATDEAAVRAANTGFDSAIQRQDVATVVAAYAPEGALLWEHDPRMSGPAIRQAWAQAFGLAGFGLHLHSRTIKVARAGDLALDEGSLELELPGPAGAVSHPGKYLVVWQKVDGAWKILYDVYNTDTPPAPAVAAKQP